MKVFVSHYALRISVTIMNKLKYIAKENGRSANKEIEQLIIEHIKTFERDNYEILQEDIDFKFENDY